MPTAFITHPSFLLHDMGPYHPECPERLMAISDRLIASGIDPYLRHYYGARGHARADRAGPRRRLHRRDRGGEPEEGLHYIDPDTAMNPHTLAAARTRRAPW